MESNPFLFGFMYFLLVIMLLLSTSSSAVAHDNLTDLSALLAFKARLNDPLGVLSTNWTTNASFCTWTGVSCSRRRQRVVSLRLAYASLQGPIAPELANLSFLSSLDLANNALVGSIPCSLSQLHRLKLLVLENNQLSGSIPPPIIFNMSSLTRLFLAKNNLSGPLPSNSSFTSTPHPLHILALSRNQLTGNIPPSLYLFYQLRALSLTKNQLTGTLPMELGNLKELQFLYLGENSLTGSIPTSLGNLTALLQLQLPENHLHGVIPEGLGALLHLQGLLLDVNYGITGPIPSSLSNMSSLEIIGLGDNKLVGPIRVNFGNMPSLRILDLGNNKLTGRVSDLLGSLSRCRALKHLDLEDNQFHGSLPNTIGNLSTNLLSFSVSGNRINGQIPAELGNLTGLFTLDLSQNDLIGTLPSEIALLQGLQALHVADNKLHGAIPHELGQLKRLNDLYLFGSHFSGPIPESIGNMSYLEHILLDHNELTSEIPQSIWNLTHLIDLDLSHNFLNGSLSTKVANMKLLNAFDLSVNQLSGEIPSSLKELQMLAYLDLSSNSFNGQIPQSFGELISIETLNLSRNNLSDLIPDSLSRLRHLSKIDLSFNRLDGKIPSNGVFANVTIQSLVGNAALCGVTALGFPSCSIKLKPSDPSSGVHLLKYILPPTAFFIILFACFCILRKKSHQMRPETQLPGNMPSVNDYRLISYHELVRATENFSEMNLLGRGSFGAVFKGHLDDRMLVAIKVLDLEVNGAARSFDVECEALRMVRHKNLVKIISTCSNLDFKALILQFMPNGTLERWLYSHDCCLNMLQRINIVIDVASALKYLHHDHSPVVLHRDVKPSNILLDEDLSACVSDFGIAKLLTADSQSLTSISSLGTLGYVAPECASTGSISRKGDVYSFGILLLEMFTKKKPIDPMFNGGLSLRQWVCRAHPRDLLDIVDQNLLKDASRNERQRKDLMSVHACLCPIMELGIVCSQNSPKERPEMKDIVLKLQKIKMDTSIVP